MQDFIVIQDEVKEALLTSKPVLALESTIITHGLPWPQNCEVALELEAIARSHGVLAATIAVVAGKLKVGLKQDDIETLAKRGSSCLKLSSFDIPWAIAQGQWGSTTVAGTMFGAAEAGIKVFATGGIGGVHRDHHLVPDVSHDLEFLSRVKMIVVSAGAKAILDLPATMEYLETKGILTIGFQCDEFPAFYYRKSGIPLPYQTSEVDDIVKVFKLVSQGSLLVANPIAEHDALAKDMIESCIAKALRAAQRQGIKGKDLTPFLLSALAQETEGKSVRCNLALIRNNVRLASRIVKVMQSH